MTLTKKHITSNEIVVSLLRKEIKEFYGNINTNILTENRIFWKTVKSFLVDKTKKFSRVTLIEKEGITSEDMKMWKLSTQNMPRDQEFESFDSSKKILF